MSDSQYILALDQGTTSSRAIVFNQAGEIVSQAQQEFTQHYPKPGWVEHDAMEIWSSQVATLEQALAEKNLRAKNIAGIGITNQRETTVVWDRATGLPIHNAIVWQDRRTAKYCSQLKQDGLEAIVSQKTGLRLDPYFAGSKLRWLLQNIKGARERAQAGELCFGTIDSWLLWNLTNGQVHATDASNASRTLLYNLESDDWDDELLQLFDIPRAVLPEIRGSSEVYGEVATGRTLAGVPIAGMAGDQHAVLFGQCCLSKGMAKNTYGTGCFLLMHTGDQPVRSQNNLLSTVAWRINGKTEYALEGSIFVAGAVVQWLRDEMELVKSADELNQLAASVPDSNGLLLVPAFTGLGAPHWDPYARGIAVGITRGTKRAHFCRAALEAIAYQSADLITAMEKDSGIHLKTLRVDGGASRSDLLLQIQSDLLQIEVQRPNCVETTALGAAYLAGLAVGYWEGREAIKNRWQVAKTFKPEKSANEIFAMREQWTRALERAKGWEDLHV
jgi:glycerol kinase